MSSRSNATERPGFRWDDGLLGPDDPDPVGHEGADREADVIVICDHAGNLVPARLGDLGVPAAAMERHVAYDPGALGVARAIADRLGAELLFQRYSRLVIDCNRPPHRADAFVARVDGVAVRANAALAAWDVARRVAEIFLPYQARIDRAVALRLARGVRPAIVSVHSFTPHHGDRPGPRPWDVSVLFNRDGRLALALRDVLARDAALTIGVNEPYKVDDAGDYAIPVHAERLGLHHVEIEVRQDRIATAADEAAWGARLAEALREALASVRNGETA